LSVSRLHAQLERAEDGWLLADLGSHNGTRVNGWRIREPVPVRAGDVLQFGSAAFVIHDREGPGGPVRDGRDGRDGREDGAAAPDRP
jgi:pSer/pThr/pTyr-binding forkhead associated (FHA) protein